MPSYAQTAHFSHRTRESLCRWHIALRTSGALVTATETVSKTWFHVQGHWPQEQEGITVRFLSDVRVMFVMLWLKFFFFCVVLFRCVRFWAVVPVQLSFLWSRCRRGSTKWETPVHWSSLGWAVTTTNGQSQMICQRVTCLCIFYFLFLWLKLQSTPWENDCTFFWPWKFQANSREFNIFFDCETHHLWVLMVLKSKPKD